MKSRGGKRDGAGRPQGIGKYSCVTKPMRVPVDMIEQIDFFIKANLANKLINNTQAVSDIYQLDAIANKEDKGSVDLYHNSGVALEDYKLPLYDSLISAGLPSPADDHVSRKLNLNEYLIPRPNATFFVKVTGDSMIDANIHEGDLLIVDRSIEAKHNKIIIAALGAELTVKRLYKKNGILKLVAENPNYSDLIIEEGQDLLVWGVVTRVIHQC
ncbi:MAG: DNA polymerase V [Alphaproteobacteria bacterium]|nr:DNA polymerase V [Alphaproteobacteria bacterium]